MGLKRRRRESFTENELRAQQSKAVIYQRALTMIAFWPPETGTEASEIAASALEAARNIYRVVVKEWV